MDVKEQYACTKVMPSSAEITTHPYLQGEESEGHPDKGSTGSLKVMTKVFWGYWLSLKVMMLGDVCLYQNVKS